MSVLCPAASLGFTYMAIVTNQTLVLITGFMVILVHSRMVIGWLSVPFRQAMGVCVCVPHLVTHVNNVSAVLSFVYLLLFFNYLHLLSVWM